MEKERKTTLRSNFLVNWVGKHIEDKYKKLKDEYCEEYARAYRADEYINVLRNTLGDRDTRADGLWMTEIKEKILKPIQKIPGFEYEWLVTCFTEIKLSDVREHTREYGCLGFGFSRDFIIERYGAPVHYVTGTGKDTVSERLFRVYKTLEYLESITVKLEPQDDQHGIITQCINSNFCRFIKGSDLRQTMDKLDFEDKRINKPCGIFAYLRASLISSIIFLKSMSKPGSANRFRYLDEFEWRITYTDKMKDKEEKITGDGTDYPPYKIPFTQNDLKILILPDEEMRRRALMDCDIQKWLFKNPHELPIVATVAECTHF